MVPGSSGAYVQGVQTAGVAQGSGWTTPDPGTWHQPALLLGTPAPTSLPHPQPSTESVLSFVGLLASESRGRGRCPSCPPLRPRLGERASHLWHARCVRGASQGASQRQPREQTVRALETDSFAIDSFLL